MPMYENNALTRVMPVQNEGRILKKLITVHIPKHFKCANILQSKPICCPRQEKVLCIYQSKKQKTTKTKEGKQGQQKSNPYYSTSE